MRILILAAFLLFVFSTIPALASEGSKNNGEKPLFTWNLLWTGYWQNSINTPDAEIPSSGDIFLDGTLYNRGNLSLGLPRQDLLLRLLATDKRLVPLLENDSRAGFNPGLGIYHTGSSSRLLYGVQNYFGLPARINNIWLRSVPFMESRQPSSRDLKTEPAARDNSDTYLYLALPRNILPGFDAFASAALDNEQNPALGGGIGWNGMGPQLRLEGFYTQKELNARNPQTWFSAIPPLPEREFNIYALALLFHYSQVAFATDLAWSETFAWGEGIYGNFSLRLGHRPWR